ncbi:MAG: hypothetical protein KF730_03320 [Sphingomonas sp.]|uniref:hypothetical protein n=1 Tax=Sphingomonas sp. TaxID=28214 RepID=UPI0025CECE58|nr:hypothetical protein [Sphingomonas sp.]MBX3563588.1 hypothetical protein [Sphingomonas sp.]
MARLFNAEPDPKLDWPESIWTGEQVPVVVADEDGARRLTTMAWGLPATAFFDPVPSKQRGVIYSRDFWRSATRLGDLALMSRCLILLESFAYPAGQSGQCTRSWIGLWDRPLAAWAGVCIDGACAGVLIEANPLVEPLSSTMPRLLTADDHALWLEGATLLSLGPLFGDDEFYRENLAERWSTGRHDETLPLFGTGA